MGLLFFRICCLRCFWFCRGMLRLEVRYLILVGIMGFLGWSSGLCVVGGVYG